MKLVNYFLDTKEKREIVLVLIFIFLLISLCIGEIIFTAYTYQIKALEDLYNLIPLVSTSFIGRIIFNFYNSVTYTTTIIVVNILKAIDFKMIFVILLGMYFIYTNYHSKYINLARKISIISCGIMCTMYTLSSVFIIYNIKLTTYNTVLSSVKYLSLFIMIMQATQLIVLLVGATISLINLKEALNYTAIEIKNDEEAI